MARGFLALLIPLFFLADLASLFFLGAWLSDHGFTFIGAFFAVLLYIVVAIVVGLWLVRVGGAWSMFRAGRALMRQEYPEKELVNGLLTIIGGLLIAFPGLLSDVVGLALVFPPTRFVARKIFFPNAGLAPPAPPPGPSGAPEGFTAGAPPVPPGSVRVEIDDYRVE
ncbi:MAG: FxsA family protein [Thermoplasmatota archaeon]